MVSGILKTTESNTVKLLVQDFLCEPKAIYSILFIDEDVSLSAKFNSDVISDGTTLFQFWDLVSDSACLLLQHKAIQWDEKNMHTLG